MSDPNALYSLDSIIVYDYYDFPLSWSTKDGTHYYFATYHRSSNSLPIDWEQYWFIPLTKERLDLFENNKIDRYTLFKESELGYVYLCTVQWTEHKEVETIEKVNVVDLPYEELPKPGVYLA